MSVLCAERNKHLFWQFFHIPQPKRDEFFLQFYFEKMPRVDPAFLEELDIIARETRASIPRCKARFYGNLIALVLQLVGTVLTSVCFIFPFWVPNDNYDTSATYENGVKTNNIKLGLFAICRYGNFSAERLGCHWYTLKSPEWLDWSRSLALFGIQSGNASFVLYLAMFITSWKFHITHTSIYITSNICMAFQIGFLVGNLVLFTGNYKLVCDEVYQDVKEGKYHLTWMYYMEWWAFLLLVMAMYIQWADFATKVNAKELELRDDEFEIDDGYLILKSAY